MPEFTDSQVITLTLMQDFIPHPSETQYIAFLRASYMALFPKLVTISTLFGIPICYDLVPANTDERQAAEAVIDHAVPIKKTRTARH